MMDEPIDTTSAVPPEAASGAERAGFCQDCGRPLTTETVRRVGTGVFCEPCLATRLGANPAATPYGFGSAGVPPAGYAAPPTGYPANPGGAPSQLPSPAVAGWLGLIPGVGAMYNGQFAKGVAHLVVFVVLMSFSANVNGIFGLFAFLWCGYQSYEAYHTAKARLLGLPLPNAFGWNDIGERLGFGKTWGNVHTPGGTPANHAGTATPTPGAATPNPTPGPTPPASPNSAPPRANWFGYVAPEQVGPVVPPFAGPVAGTVPGAPPMPAPPAAAQPAAPPSWGSTPYQPASAATQPPPYQTPYYATPAPAYAVNVPPAQPLPPRRRFPVGAIWLIALGLVFLLANIDPHLRLSGMWIPSVLLGGLGLWALVRRLNSLQQMREITPVGTAHTVNMLRFPLVLLVLAVLFVLQAAHLFTLGQTWPVLLLALGLVLLLERSAGKIEEPVAFAPGYPPVPPPVPPSAGFTAASEFHPSEAAAQPSAAPAEPASGWTATDDAAKGGPQ